MREAPCRGAAEASSTKDSSARRSYWVQQSSSVVSNISFSPDSVLNEISSEGFEGDHIWVVLGAVWAAMVSLAWLDRRMKSCGCG